VSASETPSKPVLTPFLGPPGGRPPVPLHSATRAPTIQHIIERINLICAQHNLNFPTRSVASLMNLACEAKLKQLITGALTLTLSSQAISSITPVSSVPTSGSAGSMHHIPPKTPVLTTEAFQTLFTINPACLPNGSAAATKLATIPPSSIVSSAF